MGKSNTIKQQEQQNQAFQQYVANMDADMQKHVANIGTQIGQLITTHYAPYSDVSPLAAGNYSHLSTVSEWSTDSVTGMINAVQNALFGKAAAPAGTTTPTVSSDISAAIAAMQGLDLLIANAAFDVIQGILQTLGSSTSTDIQSQLQAKPLAPGMTLFIGVLESSYSNQQFFSKETIVENVYVYEVRFSIKEGQATSHLSDLQAYEDQKQTKRNILESLDQKEQNLVLGDDIDTYQLTLNKYESIIDALNTQLSNIDVKIAALTQPGAGSTAPATAAVALSPSWSNSSGQASAKALLGRLQQRRESFLSARR